MAGPGCSQSSGFISRALAWEYSGFRYTYLLDFSGVHVELFKHLEQVCHNSPRGCLSFLTVAKRGAGSEAQDLG